MNKRRIKEPVHGVTRWYSITTVAARYGVSTTEIRRWVRTGNFPQPVQLTADSERLSRWCDQQLEGHDAKLMAQVERRAAASAELTSQ